MITYRWRIAGSTSYYEYGSILLDLLTARHKKGTPGSRAPACEVDYQWRIRSISTNATYQPIQLLLWQVSATLFIFILSRVRAVIPLTQNFWPWACSPPTLQVTLSDYPVTSYPCIFDTPEPQAIPHMSIFLMVDQFLLAMVMIVRTNYVQATGVHGSKKSIGLAREFSTATILPLNYTGCICWTRFNLGIMHEGRSTTLGVPSHWKNSTFHFCQDVTFFVNTLHPQWTFRADEIYTNWRSIDGGGVVRILCKPCEQIELRSTYWSKVADQTIHSPSVDETRRHVDFTLK